MPRRPKSDLAVIVGGLSQRPGPPSDLNPRQATIWRDVVADEATDFFGTAALRHMLGDYCRHCATAELVSGLIDQFRPEWLQSADGLDRFRALCRTREAETRTALWVATKLRLTNQSRYRSDRAATAGRNAPKGKRPWDPDGAA